MKLKGGWAQEEAVVELIAATKSHCTDAHLGEGGVIGDVHAFLDADMAILGAPKERVYLSLSVRLRGERGLESTRRTRRGSGPSLPTSTTRPTLHPDPRSHFPPSSDRSYGKREG